MTRRIRVVDLFAGAGGTSEAMKQACEAAGLKLDLLAINHWDKAVLTHAANHPHASHLCAALECVEPTRAVPGGRLDVLLASPSCTHHSTARGGRPCDDQSRTSGWHVVRWAEALRPRVVIVENVREWLNWGPLGTDGKPLRSKRGDTFRAWAAALESVGYRVSWRVLNAADYGEATTRERLFVAATRGRARFEWPEPTHAEVPVSGLFGRLLPWRPAREIIDWSLKGKSIAGRKRPLSDNTLRRIAAGLARFGGDAFLAHLKGTRPDQCAATARGVGDPLGTVTAGGENHALVEPFVLQMSQSGSNGRRMRPDSEPLPTVTTADDLSVVEPFIVPQTSEGAPRAVSCPIPTITTTSRGIGIAQPFLLGQQSGATPRPVSQPAPTVATKGAIALLEPFLVSYYGTGGPRPTGEPLDTVTTRDRFGLVTGGATLDVLFRMLAPHELAAAMGLPPGYLFKGNRGETVRMIGNMVSVRNGRALCAAGIRLVA
jgi:DNA (cytosine-5)-methyltransferase 1